ncbi:hypothetical protein BSZ21_13040 [Bradyrhizobium canariense]|uniref:phospholipase D-like domain-containing protein n=1 Tax=Bradyrhizobium canariense TaxID=255045 RepID=UPI000A197C60|nr:phospholipase D-like domain-containing protein [Bradyrhizobium canariense]OSI69636.1 hypothetical protein BSZ21_13040 [Bradyrhizobium canariense]
MSIVRVVVPFKQGKRRFHLLKGRPWSVVEHLMLAALASASATAKDLEERSLLPRQVVIEALLRLMHSGWVQISQTNEGIIFHSTSSGKDASLNEELPSVQKPIARPMNLIIDQVAGGVYRRREIPLFERHILQAQLKNEQAVWIESREIESADHVKSVVSTLFDEDERFVSMEETGDRLVDRFGVAVVRDGKIEAFPARAPDRLRTIILAAAKQAEAKPSAAFSVPKEATIVQASEARSISFGSEDLVLGGKEHEELLKKTIRRCRHDLIIHSTFLAYARYEAIKPLLQKAVERGVKVHILWGKSDEKHEVSSTRLAAAQMQDDLDGSLLGESVKVHQYSTNSHAKIIVADDGAPNSHFAVLGSCNWLYSGFQSFEASARIRDPKLCAEIVDQIAEMSCSDGHWTSLTSQLARLAQQIRSQNVPPSGRAEGSLILGYQHAEFVRAACRTAKKRIVVTSHRIGPPARNAVMIPVMAAAKNSGVNVQVYFGQASEKGDGTKAADLTMEAKDVGVRISPVFEPKVHAKILAWDDDFLVISSQNWLSADPGEGNLRREIGLYLRAPGIARRAIDKFKFECGAS